jgi:hypothetical protein
MNLVIRDVLPTETNKQIIRIIVKSAQAFYWARTHTSYRNLIVSTKIKQLSFDDFAQHQSHNTIIS